MSQGLGSLELHRRPWAIKALTCLLRTWMLISLIFLQLSLQQGWEYCPALSQTAVLRVAQGFEVRKHCHRKKTGCQHGPVILVFSVPFSLLLSVLHCHRNCMQFQRAHVHTSAGTCKWWRSTGSVWGIIRGSRRESNVNNYARLCLVTEAYCEITFWGAYYVIVVAP